MNPELNEYLEVLGFSAQPFGRASTLTASTAPAPDAPIPASPAASRTLDTSSSATTENSSTLVLFASEGGADNEIAASQLLKKMITAMGLKETDVKIVSKRMSWDPVHEEISRSRPRTIVALGTEATQALLQTETAIGGLRGSFHKYPQATQSDDSPISVMPTYAPAFLLRNPAMKKPVWEDLQKVMEQLGLKS